MLTHKKKTFLKIAGISICMVGLGYGAYRFILTSQQLSHTQIQLTDTIQMFTDQIAVLETSLADAQHEIMELSDGITGKNFQIRSYEQALEKTTGDFKKLQMLDPELLQKYSKVYFLNEHYIPTSLTTIDPLYINGKDRALQIHTQVWPRLENMLEDATDDDLSLLVTSAYRSFGTQANLKANYKVTYGTSAANRFSADQGYSEHQLGTTVDLTTAKLADLSSTFEKTPEYAWLTENAYKYGFVLSYPKNNKYYIYEPWHWRYVGVDLATKLHDEGDFLYNLDQREISGYLLSIFD